MAPLVCCLSLVTTPRENQVSFWLRAVALKLGLHSERSPPKLVVEEPVVRKHWI